MRSFVRPNKGNDSRRRHSEVYYAVDPVACGALYIVLMRGLLFRNRFKAWPVKESVDILFIAY